jgi:hypothetical protein
MGFIAACVVSILVMTCLVWLLVWPLILYIELKDLRRHSENQARAILILCDLVGPSSPDDDPDGEDFEELPSNVVAFGRRIA